MAEGDTDFIVSVISVFLEEVPEDLRQLETSIASGDLEQTYKLAHKIKPNVDLLGMDQTRAMALEIETLGRNGEGMDRILELFPMLKRDVEQVIVELHQDFNLE